MQLFTNDMTGNHSQIYNINVLKNILTEGMGKIKPDVINGDVLTFNGGYKINKYSTYAIQVNGVNTKVKATQIDNNNIKISVTPESGDIYFLSPPPNGWEVSVDGNLLILKNKFCTFTLNDSIVFGIKGGVRGANQSYIPNAALSSGWTILIDDSSFIMSLNTSVYGYLAVYFLSDMYTCLYNAVNSTGTMSANNLTGIVGGGSISASTGFLSYNSFSNIIASYGGSENGYFVPLFFKGYKAPKLLQGIGYFKAGADAFFDGDNIIYCLKTGAAYFYPIMLNKKVSDL